jgi:NAD+ kinase
MRLQVTFTRQGQAPMVLTALNDAVIHQGAMARLVELDAYVDAEFVSAYRADGLIVATPTGSTAYNMAAGGPILIPGQAAMTLTPICAHSLTNRPLVVPSNATIRIRLGAESRGVVLTVDGQWAHSFMPGDALEITAARAPLTLFESEKRYFDIMRDKLQWGLRSDRNAR